MTDISIKLIGTNPRIKKAVVEGVSINPQNETYRAIHIGHGIMHRLSE